MQTILIGILVTSIFLFAFTFIAMKIMNRKMENNPQLQDYELMKPKKAKKRINLTKFYLASYKRSIRIPLFKKYVFRVRRKISSIHSYDVLTLRKETMRIVFTTLTITTITTFLLILINKDLLTTFLILISALVIHSSVMDWLIYRVEDRLLRQFVDLLSDVRHHFHKHGIVEESISDAAETKEYEASLHAKRIYEILTDPDNEPEKQLESYYEVAPNRFLKVFAGISLLVKEFGDKKLQDGSSMFLSAIDKLKKEINLEILRRNKLNYYLKNLTVIAIAPIFFTRSIEDWARNNFPAMNDFYTSKLGVITRLIVFSSIIISYVLLRKIQEANDGSYVSSSKRIKWEKWIYEIKPVKIVVDRIISSIKRGERFKIIRLLKDSNTPLTLEWFFIRRILLCVVLFTITVSSFMYMHSLTVGNILYNPTKSEAMFGKLSPEELQKAGETTDFDRKIILQLKGVKENLRDRIALAIQKEIPGADDKLITTTSNRILVKSMDISEEFFKWWELLISITIGIMGYYIPMWVLMFQKRIRVMEMQNEVDQLHTIIAILSEFERMNVETILEWMERYSTVFKDPLRKCLLHYDGGPEQALEQLKEAVTFVQFVRTIERLQVAVIRIPIKESFDDLETDRAFNFEQRKQDYEKIIETKREWGHTLGFAPLYILVFLYLVFPLVYMSLEQFTEYYQQMKQIQ